MRKIVYYFHINLKTFPLLTAANCIHPKHGNRQLPSDTFVVLGDHDLQNPLGIGREIHGSKKIFIHPKWDSKSVKYDTDIAVIELTNEVKLNEHIMPICLWNNHEDPHEKDGIVIGNKRSKTKQKKKLLVHAHINKDCFFKSPELAKISTQNSFCAGSNNVGMNPCLGKIVMVYRCSQK